jgi:V8-like Glu-specific endopeptidase
MHLEFSIIRRDVRHAKKYSIDRPEIVFGRVAGCDVILSHDFVSSRHAKLTVSAGGRYTLTDLGSRNGTLVDGTAISGPTRIDEGSVLTFGSDGPQMKIWALGNEAQPQPQLQQYTSDSSVPRTMGVPQTRALVIDLQQSSRRWRVVAVAGTCLICTAVLGLIVILVNRIAINADEARRKIADSKQETEKEIADSRGIDAEAIAEKNGSAVYFVVAPVTEHGAITATAFAINSSGSFATNAHVTEKLIQSLAHSLKPVLIAQGGLRTYPIVVAQSHPFYNSGDQINKQYDVGWFRVQLAPGEQLAFLKLATEEELRALKVGSPCCYIGFPSYTDEDYSSEAGIAREKVVARVYSGSVVRMMSPRRQKEGFTSDFVIEHTMYAWHGSSGSPIFNKEGHVIALLHSGDFVEKQVFIESVDAQGRKVDVPFKQKQQEVAGVTFGVRVDKLRDALHSN